MSRAISKRKCIICEKHKRTTNTQDPFICEYPCLRSKGRSLLLNLDKFVKEQAKSYFVVGVFIGVVIGLLVFNILKYI